MSVSRHRVAWLALLAVVVHGRGAPAGEKRAAFVRPSPRDPRYFELSDGSPYIPIGLNMITPPREGEHWELGFLWHNEGTALH